MEINPLSLLEVTMGNAPVEDDDCVIVEETPPLINNVQGGTLNDPLIINDDDEGPDDMLAQLEPEILADTGVHFLQQEDPLSLPSTSNGPGPVMILSIAEMVKRNVRSLSLTTPVEAQFRASYYNDAQDVLMEKLHCTICREHVGCDTITHPKDIEHPLLKVLVCPKCALAYKALMFPLSSSGKDIRCRWCGKLPGRPGSTALRFCRQCPFAFCEKCLYHNITQLEPRHVSYLCIACDTRAIWSARCVLWALQTLKMKLLVDPATIPGNDLSSCASVCQNKAKKKPRVVKPKKPPAVNNNSIKYVQMHNGQSIVVNTLPQNDCNGQVRPTNDKGGCQIVTLKRIVPKVTPPTITQSKPLKDKMSTAWLAQKIQNYESDVINLLAKLRKVREDLANSDSVQSITQKVETTTTILSLNSSLLKDCGLNLMNEWKEKRSRFEIDSINVDLPPLHPISSSNNAVISAPNLPKNNTSALKTLIKKSLMKQTTPNKRKRPPKILKKLLNGTSTFVPGINISAVTDLDELLKIYNIRQCSVRLEPLSNSILNSLIEKGFYKMADHRS